MSECKTVLIQIRHQNTHLSYAPCKTAVDLYSVCEHSEIPSFIYDFSCFTLNTGKPFSHDWIFVDLFSTDLHILSSMNTKIIFELFPTLFQVSVLEGTLYCSPTIVAYEVCYLWWFPSMFQHCPYAKKVPTFHYHDCPNTYFFTDLQCFCFLNNHNAS